MSKDPRNHSKVNLVDQMKMPQDHSFFFLCPFPHYELPCSDFHKNLITQWEKRGKKEKLKTHFILCWNGSSKVDLAAPPTFSIDVFLRGCWPKWLFNGGWCVCFYTQYVICDGFLQPHRNTVELFLIKIWYFKQFNVWYFGS